MNVIQQHMFDSYRALRQGVAAPPAPGTDEVRVAREMHEWRQFRRVLAGRPARWWRRRPAVRVVAPAPGAAAARVPQRCR
ncbi:hypothetical protein [Streptomyces caatingaensis]|uniref:Uncharacterized protein n=1 Tax=Streptomyces caatingaensis TaxID=1678637 RepID=A0A0K9XG48_9ACTN|nr:hypothetical protein [Streptomyces caatingaensis]KNB52066.1 hypothetical protein AC230_12930 [Streptomyces caatingaensis]